MSSTTRVGYLAGASMLALTGVSLASSGLDAQAYEDRIAELERQVAELRGTDWMSEARTDEIRAVVNDVLADADTRTSMLQSGMVAGWDNGKFMLGTADGSYTLKISGEVQTRFNINLQDNTAAASGDDTVYGFETRRAKINFAGNIVDPTWKYRVRGAFNRNGGGFGLDYAYIQKDLDNGWAIRAGQFKPGYLLEESVSATKQLAVDRSLVNEAFNADYVQGIQVRYAAESFRFNATAHDGAGSRNTGFPTQNTEWAVAARGEFLFAGNWSQFSDFTSWQTSDYGAKLGLGVHYQKGAFGTTTPNEVEDLRFTADFQVEGDGWNVAVIGVLREADDDAMFDVSQHGIVVQGGYFFASDLEGYARYEFGDADTGTLDDLNVITIGVNKYFANHNMKWSSDIGYSLDEIGAAWASNGVGWRQDSAGEDGQILVRTQLQLLF